MPTQQYPLQISQIKARDYLGGDLVIEQQLEDGQNYSKFIISYPSDGLKIYALLTLPRHPGKSDRATLANLIPSAGDRLPERSKRPLADKGQTRPGSLPLVIFNRGYVEPTEYATDRQYMRYVDYLARAGFAVFKSDYRGLGRSEGEIESVLSSANAADVLNGLTSLKLASYSGKSMQPESQILESQAPQDDTANMRLDRIDFNQVFIWGHSMGGMSTLQCLLANPSFKAASIWAGFVIPYADVISRWQTSPLARQQDRAKKLLEMFGDPAKNPQAWHDISPFYFLADLPCTVQLHHGQADQLVPVDDSRRFHAELAKFHKDAGLFLYPGADHNLGGDELPLAMDHTIQFFNSTLD